MTEMQTTYFSPEDREVTAATLELAVAAARQLGIKQMVIATSTGATALALGDHEGIEVTAVTSAYGQKEPGSNAMSADVRARLSALGFKVCTAAHALSGAERSLSTTFGGAYPVEIIAHTLRMFGAGTKVCVEACAMAADGGYITGGQPVVAVAGTGGGANTAIVLRPEVSSKLLKTKIDRIICKPAY